LIEYRWAVVVLGFAGVCSIGAFALMVALAKDAIGFNLGMRMSLAVGGSWGSASVILMGLGFVGERVGLDVILQFGWLGYLAAAVVAVVLLMKHKRAVELE
jgi:hypothetical protein